MERMIRLLLSQAFSEVLVGFSWEWEGLTLAVVTPFFLQNHKVYSVLGVSFACIAF